MKTLLCRVKIVQISIIYFHVFPRQMPLLKRYIPLPAYFFGRITYRIQFDRYRRCDIDVICGAKNVMSYVIK